MIDVFKELNSLANNSIYSKSNIEFWLYKNELKYKKLKKDIDTLQKDFPNAYIRNDDRLINEVKFLETYEVLIEVIECYKNELYFKSEIEYYNRIKNDEVELKSWLKMHKLDEVNMQSKFRELFQNTSTSSGYEFIIRYPFGMPVTIEVNELDFQNTIEFIRTIKLLINGNNRKN